MHYNNISLKGSAKTFVMSKQEIYYYTYYLYYKNRKWKEDIGD